VRYDPVTTTCASCGSSFHRRGRQRFCSAACRQRAYRQRTGQPETTTPPARTATIVYECASCGSRLLGQQRCPDCNTFCQRLGPGGLCPHCDEPTLLSELS
jgi:hypothetical protein